MSYPVEHPARGADGLFLKVITQVLA